MRGCEGCHTVLYQQLHEENMAKVPLTLTCFICSSLSFLTLRSSFNFSISLVEEVKVLDKEEEGDLDKDVEDGDEDEDGEDEEEEDGEDEDEGDEGPLSLVASSSPSCFCRLSL